MKNLLLVFFAILGLLTNLSAQRAGDLDRSFNYGRGSNYQFNYGYGADDYVYSIALQSDGKILTGGRFTTYNGTARNKIARLNRDGSLDNSFNSKIEGNSHIKKIAVQPDGKILIVSGAFTYNNLVRYGIARLNTDGSIDSSFSLSGSGANYIVESIALQSDSKILIGGYFTAINGIAINKIARLNTDGSLDTSFIPAEIGVEGIVKSINIQTNGKILIGGQFLINSDTVKISIARLNTDGSLDTNFNSETGANSDIWSIALQSDGKILVGGYFHAYSDSTSTRDYIARLNRDGSLDTSFNPGTRPNKFIQSIALQTDGKILIGGDFASYNGTARNCIARLNTDGSLDTSFNPGIGANYHVESIVLQSDGNILIGGGRFSDMYSTLRNEIVRLNTYGNLDISFNPGTGANEKVFSIAIQSDGKTLIGGGFTAYNGIIRNSIARLNRDGSLDNTFNTSIQGRVYSIVIQSDGMILIGGEFASTNGITRNCIARLNFDGSMDSSFNHNGTGVGERVVYSIAIQSDGKILIGGSFAFYNGITRKGIARLNTDGSLDSSFNYIDTGASYIVHSIAIQSDGKILNGGAFASTNGITRTCISRLNTDGGMDNSFSRTTDGFARSISIQSDGRILINSTFTTNNGITHKGISRLNSNGSLDTSFNPAGAGANLYIYSILLQPDGKILIGGDFNAYNGIARNRIARLNDDGDLDTSFNPGAGANKIIFSIALQPDGNILIGGDFTGYNNLSADGICRIHGSVGTNPIASKQGKSSLCPVLK